MKVSMYSIEGNEVGQIDLPSSISDVEMNEGVLHTVYKAYRANQRQGTHATKTRSTVSGGGKKPFKQKGTGNARQGSSRSPLNPGGGISHGPQPRSYRQKINKKVKRLALRMLLKERAAEGRMIVVQDYGVNEYKSTVISKAIKNLSKIKKFENGKKLLFSDERKDSFLSKSTKNIKNTKTSQSSDLNIESLLSCDRIVLSETALKALEKRFMGA